MDILSVDDEWSTFLTNEINNKNKPTKKTSTNIINTNNINTGIEKDCVDTNEGDNNITLNEVPICEDLYISTKTKVLFLNQAIDIHSVFWSIPITEYWVPKAGVVKKQLSPHRCLVSCLFISKHRNCIGLVESTYPFHFRPCICQP
jgi:hypothetical protein